MTLTENVSFLLAPLFFQMKKFLKLCVNFGIQLEIVLERQLLRGGCKYSTSFIELNLSLFFYCQAQPQTGG